LTLNRYAKRRDANEHELVVAARKLGAIWVYSGPLDGWCFDNGWGAWTPVEVKRRKGKYTDAQKSFLALCEAKRARVWTWRTMDDVLASLGAQ
jgi:hypothetical protein